MKLPKKARTEPRAAALLGKDKRPRPLRRALYAGLAAVLLIAGLLVFGEREPPAAPAPSPVLAPAGLPAGSIAQPAETGVQPGQALAPVAAQDVPDLNIAPAQPATAAVAPGAPAPGALAVPEPLNIVQQPAGHVVQLGVFGAQPNAERLRDALVQGGFQARIESRVVLGPYPDRAAAEAAQAALRRAGQAPGMLVPPPSR